MGYLGNILDRRELVRNLVVRHLKLRYKSSALGFLWSMLNPLAMVLTYVVVFSMILRMDVPNYPVFLLCGLIPWRFFSLGVMGTVGAIVHNRPLVTKVYFPREILPLSRVLSDTVSLLIELLILFVFIIVYDIALTGAIALVPIVIALNIIFVYGLALIVSSLYVFLRDVNQIVEIVMNIGFFLTPILYDISRVPPRFLPYYSLNPMVGFVTLYKKVLFYGQMPTGTELGLTFGLSVLTLIVGYKVFYHLEPRFAEEV